LLPSLTLFTQRMDGEIKANRLHFVSSPYWHEA
jgi:hypothetical protein